MALTTDGLTTDKLASVEALAGARRPRFSLSHRLYTDPGIHALELERIVGHAGFLAGHVSEFADPGDFRVDDPVPTPARRRATPPGPN